MEQNLQPLFEENELLNSNCNTPKKEERELDYNDNKSVIIQDGDAEAPLLDEGKNLETFLCCSPNKIEVTETTICDDLLNAPYLLPSAEELDLRDVTMVASTETTRIKPRESLLSNFDPYYFCSPIGDVRCFATDLVNEIIERAIYTIEKSEPVEPSITFSAKEMADISDKLALQEEETADLKLQLNASQQVRASLELQLRQKEEVIIKSQAEAARKDQTYKLEVKQLKEKLEEKCLENDNSPVKDMQEIIKTLKAREVKLLTEISVHKNDEQNYKKIIEEYEKTLAARLSEMQKLMQEHETVKQHLANLEVAFSDVHQKYERSKKIIDGYKSNEDALRQALMSSEDTVYKSEEKYDTLKAHAKAQIEKSNQEMQLMRDQYNSEIHKLSAINKRLEIKNASLADSLDQKTKECSALAALCDEVTGKV